MLNDFALLRPNFSDLTNGGGLKTYCQQSSLQIRVNPKVFKKTREIKIKYDRRYQTIQRTPHIL